jgi:trehalose 6-phosphate phosphatase
MTLPQILTSKDVALFLDFDGTLVEIAEHPEAVVLGDATRQALVILSEQLDGALAIITGREIAAIDRFLAPLRLPVAGVHGLARRDAAGHLNPAPDNSEFVDDAAERLQSLVDAEDGLMLERKAGSLALHYRARPELEAACLTAFEYAVNGAPGIELKRGKMVLEAKPVGADKGTALIDFMSEHPFLGRTPVFAGDDVTDEDAFQQVNNLQGISIKVGKGPTLARYRVGDTGEFLSWLEKSAERLGAEGER